MSPTNGRSDQAQQAKISGMIPSEFAEFSKQRLEALAEIQKEFLETLESFNQVFFERAKTEANLTSEMVAKLSSARSVPETADACRELLGKRMEILADDSRRFFAEGQKFMELGARFLTNGSTRDAA